MKMIIGLFVFIPPVPHAPLGVIHRLHLRCNVPDVVQYLMWYIGISRLISIDYLSQQQRTVPVTQKPEIVNQCIIVQIGPVTIDKS